MVNIKHSQILLILEAVGKRRRPCGRYLVTIEEEHMQSNMLSQCICQLLGAAIVDIIFTQIHSLFIAAKTSISIKKRFSSIDDEIIIVSFLYLL